ncbi:MAG: beta strand repeat-containing protein [Kineosporiaceae bacterium]
MSTDPDGAGPLTAGVYTHVTWDAAALAAGLGSADLAAAGTFRFDYVAAVPLRANTTTWSSGEPAPAGGTQAANLDNNTGPSTAEPPGERSATNLAEASGTYAATSWTADDSHTVTLEDLRIVKSADDDALVQGDVTTWTLDLAVSEYVDTASSLVVTDTVPDGLCPGSATGISPGSDAECTAAGAPSLGYTSATENTDGTWTLVWQPADLTTNGTASLSFETVARAFYQDGGADDTPVQAQDSWTNDVDLTGTVTARTGTTDTGPRALVDSSSAGQSAGPISLSKEVADSYPDPAGCGDGTGTTWQPTTTTTTYGPGDRVCWRLTVTTPANLDSSGVTLSDLLPPGHELVSVAAGAGDTVGGSYGSPTVAGQTLSWSLGTGGDVDEGQVAQLVVETEVTDPTAASAAAVDLSANLAKLSYTNVAGEVFQLRDDADAPWREAELVLDKSDATGTGPYVGGESVDYDVALTNDGNQDAADIIVWDLLPAELDCADVTALGDFTACDDAAVGGRSRLSATVAGLAAGASTTLSYTVTLPVSLSPNLDLVNDAGVVSFDTATNIAAVPTFTYVPSSNIDPTAPTATTGPVEDSVTTATADVTVAKTRTTSVDEGGNSAASQATIGETITYTATVTLPGDLTLTGGEVRDDLGTRLALDTGSVDARLDGAPLPGGWSLSTASNTITVTLPATHVVPTGGQTVTVEFDAVVTDVAANVAGASLGNTARLVWDDGNVPGSVSTTVVEPDIGVAKSSDATGPVAAGDVVTYTVDVTNAGSSVSTAHDVVVVDTLPDELTPLEGVADPAEDGDLVPPDNGTWDASVRTITWSLPSIAPGATPSLGYSVQVADPLTASSPLSNTVAVTASSLAGTPAGERDDASGHSTARYAAGATETLTGPPLAVTKSVDVTDAAPGDVVTYTVTATVPADTVVADLAVVDVLPAGLTHASTVSATCTSGPCSGVTVTTPAAVGQRLAWWVGDLLTSASTPRVFTIVHTATVDDTGGPTTGDTLTNSAVAVGNTTDTITGAPFLAPDPAGFDVTAGPATVDVGVVEPTLTVDKEVADEGTPDDTRRVVAGEELDFSVTVTNTGTSTAYDAVVTDTTDPRFEAVTVADGTGWSVTDADPADGTLTFALDPLAPAASVTITYTLRVPALDAADEVAGPELTNTADATYASGTGGGARAYDDVAADTVSLEADLASVGDLVWLDLDGDGARDVGEGGIPGVDVTVVWLGPGGTPGGGDDETWTTTTGADGTWSRTGLPAGAFTATVDAGDLPAGTAFGYDLDGGADGTAAFTLAEDEDRDDVDVAAVGSNALGDLVWLDLDDDGVRDAGEPGVDAVDLTVTWLGGDGAPGGGDDVVLSATTDAAGAWGLGGLPDGSFTVALTGGAPTGYGAAYDEDGGRDGRLVVTGLTGGATHDTADLALVGTRSLGDRVWLDRDRDGAQDTGEPGIAGVDVTVTWAGPDGTLDTGDDVSWTDATGADGRWRVDALPPGVYRAAVDAATLPGGVSWTFDRDDATSSPDGVWEGTLAAAADRLDIDTGVVGAGSVTGIVFVDTDGDGVRDPGESGLPGVPVTVRTPGPDGVLGTADDLTVSVTSGEGGRYTAAGLPFGSYRVSFGTGTNAGTRSLTVDGEEVLDEARPAPTAPDATDAAPGGSGGPGGAGLASTGGPVLPWLALALALLVAGGLAVLLVTARRRPAAG